MKRFLSLAAFAAVCISASAQSKDVPCDDCEEWGTSNSIELYVQYNPTTLETDAGDLDFTGFTIGFQKAYNISAGGSWYIEPGIALSYAYWDRNNYDDYDSDSYKEKINLWSLKVPVNFVYKWDVSDNLSILPFAGVTFSYYFDGKYELRHHDDDYDDDDISVGLFDDDEMEDELYCDAWKRLQIGWQIGCNVLFNEKFFLGFSHGKDFYGVRDGAKFKTTSLTLGYCF